MSKRWTDSILPIVHFSHSKAYQSLSPASNNLEASALCALAKQVMRSSRFVYARMLAHQHVSIRGFC